MKPAIPPKPMDRDASFAALAALDEGGSPNWPAEQEDDQDPPYRLLRSFADSESLGHQLSWLLIAAVVITFIGFVTFSFWAPAHGGVDQNGYLVGGKQFSHTLSTRFVPASPYEYVGNMWVMVGDKDGTYYPKYPLGLPVLYAIMLWIGKIGGGNHGLTWVFMVSPIANIVAMFGMFFLARALAGSFSAVLAVILLASSPLTLALMDNPNSHASCMAFVVWGMFFLLRWWQTNSIWRGLLAGFLLGYACTIRYTEGLLVLPIAVAMITSLKWTRRRSYLRIAMPMFGWLLPVGYLLIFNKIALGTWTGYGTTNESEAFTWGHFVATWEQVVRTFNDRMMFFTLPLGLAGIGMVFRRSRRYGLMLLLWLIPGIALYASYYWSPDRGVAYARFFLTFLPALALGAAIFFRHGLIGSDDFGQPRRSFSAPITAGMIVAAAAGLSMYRASLGMENGQTMPNQSLVSLHEQYASLAVGGDLMVKNIPANSIVFADAPRMAEGMLNYAQFMGDWELYPFTAFTGSVERAFFARKDPDPNDPNPLQPRRQQVMSTLYEKKSEQDLANDQRQITMDALNAGRHVYLVGVKSSVITYEQKWFPSSLFDLHVVTRWTDQVEPTFGFEEPKPDDRNNRFGGAGQGMRRRNGGPGGPGGPGGLGPGGPGQAGPAARGGFDQWTSSSWLMVEATLKKPATTQP